MGHRILRSQKMSVSDKVEYIRCAVAVKVGSSELLCGKSDHPADVSACEYQVCDLQTPVEVHIADYLFFGYGNCDTVKRGSVSPVIV